MKIGILVGNFNPVNQRQVEYGLNLIKQEKLDFLFFKADNKDQLKLLNIALKAYRKLGSSLILDDSFIEYKCPNNLNINILDGDLRLIDKNVLKYIFNHRLYIDQICANLLSEHRYNHVKSVSEVCIKLAKKHHVDENEAYLVGMLHDITKELDKDKTLSIMESYYPQFLDMNYKVYHQFTAVIYLNYYFKYFNNNVLNAIRHHVNGTSNSKLAKIVYIADKIDPSRGYNVEYEMKLALNDLDAAFNYVKETQRKYLKEKEGINV